MAVTNSLSAIKSTIFTNFHQTLAQQTELFASVGSVRTDDAAFMQLSNTFSGGIFQAYTGPAQDVKSNIGSGKAVITSHGYADEQNHTFQDLLDNKDLSAQVAVNMANAAAASINGAFFTGLESLFGLAHPLAGADSEWTVGASKKYLDTGLAYLGTGTGALSGAGTQDTLIASPLGRSSYNAGLNLLLSQKNIRGIAVNPPVDSGSLKLVCHPNNRDVATQILGSALASQEMQSNAALQGSAGLVTYPLAHAGYWFLVSRLPGPNGQPQAPVGMWIRKSPMVTVGLSPNQLDVIIAASYTADFYYLPEGLGIIGSNASA